MTGAGMQVLRIWLDHNWLWYIGFGFTCAGVTLLVVKLFFIGHYSGRLRFWKPQVRITFAEMINSGLDMDMKRPVFRQKDGTYFTYLFPMTGHRSEKVILHPNGTLEEHVSLRWKPHRGKSELFRDWELNQMYGMVGADEENVPQPVKAH